jgi:hypothetical protein
LESFAEFGDTIDFLPITILRYWTNENDLGVKDGIEGPP